jgi:hypothetical protein
VHRHKIPADYKWRDLDSFHRVDSGRPYLSAAQVVAGSYINENLIGGDEMFLIIGCVLLVLWLLGFVLLKKAVGGLIHIVLIIALVVLAVHFLKGG